MNNHFYWGCYSSSLSSKGFCISSKPCYGNMLIIWITYFIPMLPSQRQHPAPLTTSNEGMDSRLLYQISYWFLHQRTSTLLTALFLLGISLLVFDSCTAPVWLDYSLISGLFCSCCFSRFPIIKMFSNLIMIKCRHRSLRDTIEQINNLDLWNVIN